MKISELSSANLLRACVDTGAKEEWAEFIARYHSLIAGVISRIVGRYHGNVDTALVDDLIQETYLRLCRNDCRVLRQFQPEHEASFFGYLKDVASSVARDYFRAQNTARRGRETAPLDEVHERQAINSQKDNDESLISAEVWRHLDTVTQSERDKAVFKLYFQQGFTAKEVAALPAMNLSEKGVESCLHRLVSRLKDILISPSGERGKAVRGTLGDVG